MNLDPAQLAAASDPAPAVMVVACPGAGKTAVLVEAVAQEVRRGTPARGILVVTFTRKAAAELRSRFKERELDVRADTLDGFAYSWVRTKHEACGYLRPPIVVDDETCKAFITTIQRRLGKAAKPEVVALAIENEMRAEGIVDHRRVLTHFRKLLADGLDVGITSLYVDEYQDTDGEHAAVYAMIQCRRRFVVGDPDQSIFGWRGATPAFMAAFRSTYNPTEHRLLTNYRSGSAIVAVADKVRNGPGETRANREGGTVEIIDPGQLWALLAQDALGVANGLRVAVLARTNRQLTDPVMADLAAGFVSLRGLVFSGDRQRLLASEACQTALAFMGLPADQNNRYFARLVCRHLLPSTKFADMMVMSSASGKTLYAVLAEQAGPHDPQRAGPYNPLHELSAATSGDLLETVMTACGQARGTREQIRALARATIAYMQSTPPENRDVAGLTSFISGLQTEADLEAASEPCLAFLTIHASKGLEFDRVYVLGCDENLMPPRWARGDAIEEERRLLYVATTRAKDVCRFVVGQGARPTRFLAEVAA